MFLDKILIYNNRNEIIRDISFKKGLNLIIDETPLSQKGTGNNVGKTTVLRLVDFCFGGDGKNIYQDTEFAKQPNTVIENFLKDNEVIIKIVLVDNLDYPSNEIIILKNFLHRKRKIQQINNENITDNKEFDQKLKELIFNTNVDKPTFRQIISKNIRDEKNKMLNIVKVLNAFTTKEEYEALYLFWLGINTNNHSEKEKLVKEKTKEENFQKRLRKNGELSLIEQQLAIINEKISHFNNLKRSFNVNDNLNSDIELLNNIKSKISRHVTELGRLQIRRELIFESKEDLEKEYCNINTREIRQLYEKAKALIPSIQVSFEETVKFHNDLLSEKLEYITRELPDLEKTIKVLDIEINELHNLEVDLLKNINISTVLEDYDKVIIELNNLSEQKGGLEEQKKYWLSSIEKLHQIEEDLKYINDDISTKDSLIQSRIMEFNKSFIKISEELYGEEYLLSSQKNDTGYDLIVTNLQGNVGTGKKKGQIAAFDFAYIQFADRMDIKSLHFIMHDQLETVHDNQLNTIINVANKINGQYIVPILRDKIPSNLDVSEFEILTLSQENKLFKVTP